ncbi:adenylate/guanylate cyclase domain-containing protein [Tardiphaga sp. P9-11]|jgi:adenylate cyclase|uniref:adenylate/guanylate cyclase domain-containing protein n=1 Tax=Tardiphaga sp. P9-11 TaxID=2024614 RepID=UPI0011F39A2B|nr:adenylate/guanylate cyclase domain-containing protein [Tardiphaga sp. P9-11]KAA0076502.1 adenylate/guanylate cyclase domain-containing protein [Tardiphaga sp. P9-11]
MIQFFRTFLKPADDEPSVREFRNALSHQMLLTEQLRLKALIITVAVLVSVASVAQLVAPSAFVKMSRGGFNLTATWAITAPFLLFELGVLYLVGRRIRQRKDIPVLRRYFSALIETSLPTAALYLHMTWMGPETGLAFAAPLTYFLFIILSTLRLDFWLSAFTGLVSAAQMFALAMLYHPAAYAAEPPPDTAFQLLRAVILLVGGVLAGGVGVQLKRQFEASIVATSSRDRVTNLFGQHVSPQVVERLLSSGASPTTEMQRVAVMFVDIRNFTAATRTHTPTEVVRRLDEAFAVLVDVLDSHSGIVNKFLGDGFLALFGAPIEDPKAAQCAVEAARQMLAAMEENNCGNEWPLRIGIGIHMGAVIAGNVGSPRRKEYTVIGDTVNFAARLEALNKQFGSQLLISASIRDALGETCSDAELLGDVPIRGYDLPQAIWRLG